MAPGTSTRAAILRHRFYGPALAPLIKPRDLQVQMCCGAQAQEFVEFLSKNTYTFPTLNIRHSESLEASLADCCNETWAVVELFQKEIVEGSTLEEVQAAENVTFARIHMHPYALPDIE